MFPLYSKDQEEAVEERRVRWNTLIEDGSNVEYSVGDYIEVKHKSAEGAPEGWCLAKIIHKRDEFFFVHYENYENIYDEIVIIDQIRPVNTRDGPTAEELHRNAIKVPANIIDWCTTDDCVEKFDTIISKTNVYNVSYRPVENEIVIIGKQKPVQRASILVTFVIDHQHELIQLENENIKISKNIESKRLKIRGNSVEEVLVPKDLLGLIIGKQGVNISYVKQEFGVGIHIVEPSDEDVREYTETEIPEDKALIRIFGKEQKWVKLAKREIYLQKVNLPIEADKVDYVKGYQNSIVNDIKEKSRCVKVFVHDPEKGSNEAIIEAIGNEDAIENLKMLLETHLGFYSTYQSKENTNRELSKQMNKINTNYADAFYGNEGYKNQGNANNRRRNKKA